MCALCLDGFSYIESGGLNVYKITKVPVFLEGDENQGSEIMSCEMICSSDPSCTGFSIDLLTNKEEGACTIWGTTGITGVEEDTNKFDEYKAMTGDGNVKGICYTKKEYLPVHMGTETCERVGCKECDTNDQYCLVCEDDWRLLLGACFEK